jgi:hypothetical protein
MGFPSKQALTRKNPSVLTLLYERSGTGRECPEQISGIFLELEDAEDKEEDEVGVLIAKIYSCKFKVLITKSPFPR